MDPVSCFNTHRDVTDLVNHGLVKNTKTSISWERNKTFLRNKKNLNLCLTGNILRSYCFLAEVIFKKPCQKESSICGTCVSERSLFWIAVLKRRIWDIKVWNNDDGTLCGKSYRLLAINCFHHIGSSWMFDGLMGS